MCRFYGVAPLHLFYVRGYVPLLWCGPPPPFLCAWLCAAFMVWPPSTFFMCVVMCRFYSVAPLHLFYVRGYVLLLWCGPPPPFLCAWLCAAFMVWPPSTFFMCVVMCRFYSVAPLHLFYVRGYVPLLWCGPPPPFLCAWLCAAFMVWPPSTF